MRRRTQALTVAILPTAVRWPAGFDPRAHGAIRVWAPAEEAAR